MGDRCTIVLQTKAWIYIHIFKLNTGQISSYFWILERISDKYPEIAGLLSTGQISRNSWIVRKHPEIAGRMSRKFFTVYSTFFNTIFLSSTRGYYKSLCLSICPFFQKIFQKQIQIITTNTYRYHKIPNTIYFNKIPKHTKYRTQLTKTSTKVIIARVGTRRVSCKIY